MKFYTTAQISENISETPEGYLVCVGVPIARTGEMVYGPGETPLKAGEDGKVIITRDAEDVFKKETIASFEGKAVTILHPDEFVRPDNWSELAKGIVQNVRKGNDTDLVADLLITDSYAIELVKNGLREVSCGYEAEYEQTGDGKGRQFNIIGNHLALVLEGRAGSKYSIIDSKGKGLRMKLQEKIKSIFAKAQDEAMKEVECSKDENTETPITAEGMKKYFDDKFAALMGEKKEEKDAISPPGPGTPAEYVAKDDEQPASNPLESRLAKLEEMVAKLVGREQKEESVSLDEKEEGEEKAEDEAEEEEMVADSTDMASRMEILAPGLKAQGKDAKFKALVEAYKTKDGKAVIDQFTGGKAPTEKDSIDALFVGASELLKEKRGTEFTKTKVSDFKSQLGMPEGVMTAERMNEINQKHYKGDK